MALEYTNRRGDVYYLQAGVTKTGKTSYHFGRKLKGTPLDELPEGYEIYESPEAGQVFLRKQRVSRISALERELAAQAIRREAGLEHFIVNVEDDSLVVYLPNLDSKEADDLLGRLMGIYSSHYGAESALFGAASGFLDDRASFGASRKEELIQGSQFTKMMRFTLVDEDERLFRVDRWCFRGSIDNWHFLEGAAPLDKQLQNYAKHLSQESFYDLM